MKKQIKDNTGSSVSEDLKKLKDSGINTDTEKDKKEPAQMPDTKEQQKTGDTSRSDRRL